MTGIALGLPGWAAKSPSPAARPIGLQLFTLGKAVERVPEAVLAQLAGFGYSEVEAIAYATLAPSALRRAAVQAGLQIRCAHLDFASQEDPSPAFDMAHELGVLQVASSVLPPTARSTLSALPLIDSATVSDYQRIAARANRIGEAAQRAGLSYAYHNHNFEFRDLGAGVCGYDVLLRETEPRYVKFQLDCAWIDFAGKDAVTYLKNHAGRFSSLHIKNVDVIGRSTTLDQAAASHFAELGLGVIDYRPIVAQALRQHIPYLIIEHDPQQGVPIGMDMVKREFDFLHGLLEHRGPKAMA
ncbi:sugar phosphate isomerase/epimerase family protein [Comamonas sp. GB3 AK4-5]|uniref:sugar phosphate isomerase/epimerase family protein n=1 Tax=Comamonas sp. GB3 AK4-5 TaxID=3231487 RepID=UPI00351DE637